MNKKDNDNLKPVIRLIDNFKKLDTYRLFSVGKLNRIDLKVEFIHKFKLHGGSESDVAICMIAKDIVTMCLYYLDGGKEEIIKIMSLTDSGAEMRKAINTVLDSCNKNNKMIEVPALELIVNKYIA